MTDRPRVDFERWAEHADGSPLYRYLALRMSHDEQLNELAAQIDKPAKQNIFFAAVQHLLTPNDDLAMFYASRTETPAPPDESYESFRSFVLDHTEEILEIGRTRHTQTNEVRRMAVLLPAIAEEADRLGEPVHLVEVGASAGLNLCLDRFSYDYGGVRFGTSEVVLVTRPEGMTSLPTRPPYIQRRVGIDIHPVDIDDSDDLRWLESLVWPEQVERRKRLRAAIRIRRTVQVEMVQADGATSIGGVLDGLPTGGPAIVFHAFTLNQFSSDARAQFDEGLMRSASKRSLSRIGLEFWDADSKWPQVGIGITGDDMRVTAEAHHHGEWLRAI